MLLIHRSFLIISRVCLLLVSVFTVAQGDSDESKLPGEDLAYSVNTHFEIVGESKQSVASVLSLCEHVVETCERYINDLPMSFAQKVTVYLDPDIDGNPNPYAVRVESGGFVSVRFDWNSELSLSTACEGITHAFLSRLQFGRNGLERARTVRPWVIRALATRAYFKLRQAHLEHFKATYNITDSMQLGDLLLSKSLQDLSYIESYWFLKALDLEGFNSGQIAFIIDRALNETGGDFLGGLKKVVLNSNDDSGIYLEEWWEEKLKILMQRSAITKLSMEVSYARLIELSQFNSTLKLGSGTIEIKGIKDLWRFRYEPEVQAIIKERLNRASKELLQINPLYFNATQSYGLLLETFIYDAESIEFAALLIDYLDDLNAAKDLHKLTEKSLRNF